MLAQEPGLEFIGTQHFANHQIVGTIVAELGSTTGQASGLANDQLVSIHQPRQLNWNFFAATRWTYTSLDSGWTSDLWVAGDVVVRYDRIFELTWYDPGASGPRALDPV